MAYYFMIEKRKSIYEPLNISYSKYFKTSNQTLTTLPKYSKPCAYRLQEIDLFTMMFNNENELRKALIEEKILPQELSAKPLSIRCLNKGKYNKVPHDFLYQKDIEYILDPSRLVKKIMERYYQNDFVFIKKLAEYFKEHHECSSTAADIRQWSEISIRENKQYRQLDAIDKNGDKQVTRLIKLLILKHYEKKDGTIEYKNEINYRNLHAIIAFINNYDKKQETKPSKEIKLDKKEIINQHNKQKEKKQEIAAISTRQTMIETTKIEVVSKKKIRKKIYELEGQMKFF